MSAKIAVIVSTFLEKYIHDVTKIITEPQEFEIYYYTDFKSLSAIYENLPGRIKGVVTSGSFPCRVLELAFPGTSRIIKPFNNDNASICKLFLELLNSNRKFEFKRAYADVLDIIDISPDEYEDFLLGPYERSSSDLQHEYISKMDIDTLLSSEKQFVDKHIKMWKEQRIDVSITRFSSIMKTLEQAGVNARFAYPDKFYVKDILTAAVQDVTISELKENLICSIFVSAKAEESKIRESVKQLRNLLNSFGAYMNLSYHVQQKQAGFEIFTNKTVAKHITEDFTTCKLHSYLKANANFETCIGYGIGLSLYQARINAMDAHSEACSLHFGASCLINEKDQLIAPLPAEKKLVIVRTHSDTVKELSKLSGLSCLTIQKILSVMDVLSTNHITSEDLSYNLSITKRSANRFLNSLKAAGLADIVEQKQGTSKGRPEYIYKINLRA